MVVWFYGIEAARRDLAHIIKISRKEQSPRVQKNVRVIKNSGPCNSMMDRLISSA